jgi:hypothetical protein
VSAVILIVIAIGVIAGLISGRFRDAPASWVAAVVGSVLAYQATSAIDPGRPAQHSSFTGHELLSPVFLLPFIACGHLLGVWAGTAQWRSALGGVFAGLGMCAYAGYGLWSLRLNEASPGGSAAISIWIALGIWIAIGVIAGLISGRARDALASWAATVIGFMLAYLAVYGLDLGVAEPMETLAYTPVLLLPLIAGGHVFGAVVANGALRRARLHW